MNIVELYDPFIEDDIPITHRGRPENQDIYRAHLYAWRYKGPKRYMYYIKKDRAGMSLGHVIDGEMLRILINSYLPEDPILIVVDIGTFRRHLSLQARGEIARYLSKHTGEDWSKCLATGDEPTV